MIIHFIIIFNHQIPYMVSSTSIQCLHTTSNKIFVSYHFYKLRWLPTASNRIQTPYPKNSILQDFPASISSMSPPTPAPSTGYPLLETCLYLHVSWVTCSSLCLENMETIFLPGTFFIIIHALVEMWPQLSTQFKDGHSQLTLITFTLLSDFPRRKHKHLKLQHG